MKNTMPFIFLLLSGSAAAQLKTSAPVCKGFEVNVLEGTINSDLSTKSTISEVKSTFPCFTNAVDESGGTGCGGVFYKDKDISFKTERGYIEIGEKFKGKLSLPLMGASRGSLFKWLGYPKLKDNSWDAFQTKYGILIAYYNKAGKINKLQMSHYGTDNIRLCE
ncbi:MAG: hypothetical protein U0V75_18685 [Ferruginibacter sp.]